MNDKIKEELDKKKQIKKFMIINFQKAVKTLEKQKIKKALTENFLDPKMEIEITEKDIDEIINPDELTIAINELHELESSYFNL